MFTPIVVLARQVIGKKRFMKLRGNLIAKHSKVITKFCNQIGIDRTGRQNMIRLARNNGERLGFLA